MRNFAASATGMMTPKSRRVKSGKFSPGMGKTISMKVVHPDNPKDSPATERAERRRGIPT